MNDEGCRALSTKNTNKRADLEDGSVIGIGRGVLAVGFDSVGMGSSVGVGDGVSAVSALWSQASQCENHPLKLILADSQQEEVFYMPAPKRDNLVAMQRKIDRQKQEADRSHASSACSAPKVSVSKRVEFLLPKKVIPRGKEAETEGRLLGRFGGADGLRERELFIRAVAERRVAEDRAQVLKKDPHAFDDSRDVAEGEMLKSSWEGAAAGDSDAEEDDFDLSAYENDLWADSGSAFVRREENKEARKVLFAKRWIVAVVLAKSASEMTRALQKVRLKRTLVAHLWSSDRYMHAVSCVQRAFFRFLALRNPSGQVDEGLKQSRRSSLIDGSLYHAGINECEEKRRETHKLRVRGATQIVTFLRDVKEALAFKVTINRYHMSIRRLQGLLRRHFIVNKARLEALNKLFDIFSTAIISHVQVLDGGKGLDMPHKRGDKVAIMRALHKGVSKVDERWKLIAKMKTAAFHSFLRDPSVHKGLLHHISFQTKLSQGRYMMDAGGTLMSRGVRNRILTEFILRKRRLFVKTVTARLLNKGLDTTHLFGSAEEGDDEEDPKVVSGSNVTEDKVRAFLLQSESKEDLLAAEIGYVVQQVDQAKKDYIAQKKVRQNNQTCLTTWNSFFRDITVREMTHIFIKITEITAHEKADRDKALAAEREVEVASAVAEVVGGESDQEDVRGPQPTPPTQPKPSGLLQVRKS